MRPRASDVAWKKSACLACECPGFDPQHCKERSVDLVLALREPQQTCVPSTALYSEDPSPQPKSYCSTGAVTVTDGPTCVHPCHTHVQTYTCIHIHVCTHSACLFWLIINGHLPHVRFSFWRSRSKLSLCTSLLLSIKHDHCNTHLTLL